MSHDLSKYLDKLLDTLRLEVNHLFIAANKGPLDKNESTALVNYIKVLSAVQVDKEKANQSLEGKSEEELKALVTSLSK